MLYKLNRSFMIVFLSIFILIVLTSVGCSKNTSKDIVISNSNNTNNETLLITYLSNDDYISASKLLDSVIEIKDSSILNYATKGTEINDTQKSVITKLVDKGAKITLININWAIRNNDDLASLLINKTSNINDLDGMNDSFNPIYTAIYNNKPNIVKLLISKGVNPNFKLSTPTQDSHYINYDTMLQLSVLKGNIEIVDMLLGNNTDINYKNIDAETLIMMAALTNNKEMYDFLLNKGADPNIKDNHHNLSAKDIINRKSISSNIPHEIQKQNPKLGMTSEQVKNSTWGNPQKNNKTTTKYGVSEQWVYSSYRYIYFEDGIVTAIQE